MIKFRFQLQYPAKTHSPVRMVFYIDGKQFKSSLGVTVNVKEWDVDAAMPKKSSKDYPLLLAVTNKMQSLNISILQGEKVASKELVEREVFGKEKEDNVDLWPEMRRVCDAIPNDSTRRTYDAAITSFIKYVGHTKQPTQESYIGWARWMEEHRTKNGRSTYLAAVSSVINELRKQGVTTLNLNGLVTKGTDDGRGVNAIDDDELNALFQLDLQEEHLRKSRDLFLVMCLTGLSFADTKLVRTEDIGNIILRKKTGSRCLVADSQRLRDILNKYGGSITNNHVKDSSTMTKHIQRFCKMAVPSCPSFERIVRTPDEELKPFYETLGTHSGRKTFISRNYLADRSPAVIIQFTGHKSITKLDHYIRTNIAPHKASKMMVG